MQRDYLVEKILLRKEQLGWTIKKLADESSVGVRTINRILAKEDVRFSSIDAVMNALDLEIIIDKNYQHREVS